MAYNQTQVLAGGLAHIPIIIIFFKVLEKRLNANYQIKENAN
tara:strand:+ start:1416 stop:1541 length:126 start_codon:yes stop_codon:yes gene_type:complete